MFNTPQFANLGQLLQMMMQSRAGGMQAGQNPYMNQVAGPGTNLATARGAAPAPGVKSPAMARPQYTMGGSGDKPAAEMAFRMQHNQDPFRTGRK